MTSHLPRASSFRLVGVAALLLVPMLPSSVHAMEHSDAPAAPAPSTKREVPELAKPFTAPIHRVKNGRLYVDATDARMGWRRDVLRIARYDIDGRKARRQWRANPAGQFTAILLGTTFGYGAYLSGWDWTVGKVAPKSVTATGTLVGMAVSAGCLAWEVNLVMTRPKRRRQAEEAADRVIRGEAL